MPDKRHWSVALASGLAGVAERIEARYAAVSARDAADQPDAEAVTSGSVPAAASVESPVAASSAEQPVAVRQSDPPGSGPGTVAVPAQRTVRPAMEPVGAVPWSMRVAAEVGWRLLVLAGTVWVLMRVIDAVSLVVLAFAAALLITALLQPFVARLKRMGVPRGLATATVFIGGFVVMGLVGWFVVWQVMANVDDLSSSLQDGVNEGKKWLLDSPFHVTDDQINQIAKNLQDAIGSNTKALTDAGLQGVTVIVELLTGVALAMFSTLFLLYDGPNIWNWVLGLFPEAAREGLAGAGPRAWRTLTLYVRGTVLVALIDAICIGIGIFFLGVPMAVPLAVVIFVSSFVPLVGAVASGAIAVVVALVTQGPFTALMVLAVVLAVQQIEGHILQPFILGRAVRVHPLAVVLSVAAGSIVAGIGGAVVAVPLVAVSNTVVGYLRQHAREIAEAREELAIAAAHPAASGPSAASASVPAAVIRRPEAGDPGGAAADAADQVDTPEEGATAAGDGAGRTVEGTVDGKGVHTPVS